MNYKVISSLEEDLKSLTDEQREIFDKATQVMDIFENAVVSDVVSDVKKDTPFVRLGISL